MEEDVSIDVTPKATAMLELLRLSLADGNWGSLCQQWEDECIHYGESLDDYAPGAFPVLAQLASGPQLSNAGVFAVANARGFQAACQVNATLLPGYEGKVLRVRHIILSPRYDFDDMEDIKEYITVLVSIFGGAILLSYGKMPSEHVKFHLRSPVERQFGQMFTDALIEQGKFKKINMKGAWIYVSK